MYTKFADTLCLIAIMILAVVAEEMHITFVNDNPDEVSFIYSLSFLLNVMLPLSTNSMNPNMKDN